MRYERTPINAVLGRTPFGTGVAAQRLLQRVRVELGDVLHVRGRIHYVHFPIDCVVSLLAYVDEEHALECAVVGREGMVGAALGLGVTGSNVTAVVQGAGMLLRMHASAFRRELRNDSALRARLDRSIDELLAQVARTAACRAFHSIQERSACRLLSMRDRGASDRLEVTHAFLAQMLGVRREGVTIEIGKLQRDGILAYSRGHIEILDAERLVAAACSCYVVKTKRTQR